MHILKPLSLVVLLSIASRMAFAITEDESEISLRDANASRERPKLEAYDMDESTAAAVEAQKENFDFNADVSRLMDIIINSLYTKKEVFIRELISNASDALDKARFLAVADPEYLAAAPELEIKIDYDFDAKTISITDTGVGMTKAELVKNLGTVAKSGTTAFLEAMGSGDNNMSMIGQFGVGFYSAFLVANKVTVTSKSNDDEQHIWTSTADSKFFITRDPRGNTLGRGTRVTLHLKDDASEYVEQDKIKTLVKRYSEFINYPISLFVSREERVEVPDLPETLSAAAADENGAASVTRFDEEGNEVEDAAAADDLEVVSEEESESEFAEVEVKTKTVTQQVWEWEVLNDIKAIWLRPRDSISEREYKDFYRTITRDPEDPLAWTHFSAEGEIEFKAILYVPREAPFDQFQDYYSKSSAMKLYVRRVLITEEFEDLMPRYLGFIKGVVDSDDLPLNVSREQLQQMKMLKVMSKKLVRKAIDMLRDLAEESYVYEDEDEDDDEDDDNEQLGDTDRAAQEDQDGSAAKKADDADEEEEEEEEDKYDLFWSSFGKHIKLGVIEDSSNRQKLAKLLR